jgi:hypothetical protein
MGLSGPSELLSPAAASQRWFYLPGDGSLSEGVGAEDTLPLRASSAVMGRSAPGCGSQTSQSSALVQEQQAAAVGSSRAVSMDVDTPEGPESLPLPVALPLAGVQPDGLTESLSPQQARRQSSPLCVHDVASGASDV